MNFYISVKLFWKFLVVLFSHSNAHINEEQECGVEASLHPLHRDPWLVLLEYYRRGQLVEIRCGGTLVDGFDVITAAHCVKGTKFSYIIVRLGEYNTETEEDCVTDLCTDPVVRIEVSDMLVHPEYDGSEHDIAVLKLKTRAPHTAFIRPICLPEESLEENITLLAAGWGEIPNLGVFSDVKKSIPLPHVTTSECQEAYVSTLPRYTICAGGVEGVDTCAGDSGGPLTSGKARKQLMGITSLGNRRCGEKGKPGIYTDVLHHMKWIKEVIKK